MDKLLLQFLDGLAAEEGGRIFDSVGFFAVSGNAFESANAFFDCDRIIRHMQNLQAMARSVHLSELTVVISGGHARSRLRRGGQSIRR